MKRIIRNLLSGWHRDYSIKALRDLEVLLQTRDLKLAVPFVFRGRGHFRSIRPMQTPAEIEWLYRQVCELNPARVLEIGTAKGGTLYLWAQAARPDAVIASIDLPGGIGGGGYDAHRTALYQSFARAQQKMHLLRTDSSRPGLVDEIRELLGGPVDFLFIDADHRYAGVRNDFVRFAPLLTPGGLVGMHDIICEPPQPDCEVDRLWKQIKARFETSEIGVPDVRGRRLGLGLVRVPPNGFPADLAFE